MLEDIFYEIFDKPLNEYCNLSDSELYNFIDSRLTGFVYYTDDSLITDLRYMYKEKLECYGSVSKQQK